MDMPKMNKDTNVHTIGSLNQKKKMADVNNPQHLPVDWPRSGPGLT